jgi:site-specific recombinase XerD
MFYDITANATDLRFCPFDLAQQLRGFMKNSRHPASPRRNNINLPELIRSSGKAVIEITAVFLADKSKRSIETQGNYQRALEKFCTWCGKEGLTSITQVTHELFVGWIEARRRLIPTAKVLIEASILRNLFTRLRDAGHIPFNPLPSADSLRMLVRSSAVSQDPIPALIRAAGRKAIRAYFDLLSEHEDRSHTQRSHRMVVNTFLSWCEIQGSVSVAEITQDLAMRWIECRRNEVTVSAVITQASFVRHLFNYLQKERIVDANPIPRASGLRLLMTLPALETDKSKDPSI